MDEHLTHDKFHILARKITKMVFGMGGTYDEKVYVMEVVMRKIGEEITKRSPTVLYTRKKVTGKPKMDLSYFKKMLEDSQTPKKSVKKK